MSNSNHENMITECCICYCDKTDVDKHIDLSDIFEYIGLAIIENFDINIYTICTVGCCKKIYHISCLSKWLEKKNTCPMCREEIPINKKIFPNYNGKLENHRNNIRHYQRTILEIILREHNSTFTIENSLNIISQPNWNIITDFQLI